MNARTKKGETVLMAGAWGGGLDVVKYLIDKGLDVHAKDKDGKTALSHAFAQDRSIVVEYLKVIGAK
ncbi:MAG: ankyrin repeat domain-containing protein [Pseudomonadota bacterium]